MGISRTRAVQGATAGMLLLALAGCGAGKADKGGGKGPGGPMAVQVAVLKAGPLANTLSGSGSLLANESVNLQSEVGGRITAISFREGGAVQAGEVLVQINADDLKAQLKKAKAELQLAQLTEGRQEQLLKVNGISQDAFDATRAQRISKQADVDNLQALLAKATIRAPFSGVVGLRSISPGGYVAPGTPIATLTQTDPIKLDFDVPEQVGRQVKPGTTVQFTVTGDTTRHKAEIYAIEPGVSTDTRTVRVRARTANRDGRLAPGSFARVFLDLGTIPDALTIPAEGVIPDIQGQSVMVMRGGKAKAVRVELGLRTESEVQLISGVQAGDTVITSGLLAVREGMAVTPAAAKAPAATDPGAAKQAASK